MNQKTSAIQWLYLALSLLCQNTAVVLGKTAALRMSTPSLHAFLTNEWYIGGLACLVLQAFFWQLVLRQIQLVIAYLATSLSYLFVLAASRFFFLERITAAHVAGVIIIVLGVSVLVRDPQ